VAKYYDEIISKCQDIAENPGFGKNYDGISEQLFGVKVNRLSDKKAGFLQHISQYLYPYCQWRPESHIRRN